jgi:hypothetical protein
MTLRYALLGRDMQLKKDGYKVWCQVEGWITCQQRNLLVIDDNYPRNLRNTGVASATESKGGAV